MCGRFAITLPNDAMAQLFAAAPANDLPPVPNHNVCPTDPVHAVISRAGSRHLVAMRWGLLPPWYKTPNGGPLLINARSESVAGKPAFREAVRERRCLIPASGFFEWAKDVAGGRLPWFIQRADGEPIAFAGLWQDWGPREARVATCAIVTTAADGSLTAIHERVPVVIDPVNWPLWLGETGVGASRLMQPLADGALVAHRVGTEVNSNRAAGAQLIAPLV
jgi:putative SOS response-associated peptidase YedK